MEHGREAHVGSGQGMSVELFMIDGENRREALDVVSKVAHLLPAGFFDRLNLCSPFEIDDSAFNVAGLTVHCHYANINQPQGHTPLNLFYIFGLPGLMNADHAMLIHRDGYPVNPEKWDPDFLKYDYIGSIWPEWMVEDRPEHCVGSSGFCIRSKRLAQWASQIPYDGQAVWEDMWLARNLRDAAEKAGFTFAPADLAARFSLECLVKRYPRTLKDVFGFHRPKGSSTMKPLPPGSEILDQ